MIILPTQVKITFLKLFFREGSTNNVRLVLAKLSEVILYDLI